MPERALALVQALGMVVVSRVMADTAAVGKGVEAGGVVVVKARQR